MTLVKWYPDLDDFFMRAYKTGEAFDNIYDLIDFAMLDPKSGDKLEVLDFSYRFLSKN